MKCHQTRRYCYTAKLIANGSSQNRRFEAAALKAAISHTTMIVTSKQFRSSQIFCHTDPQQACSTRGGQAQPATNRKKLRRVMIETRFLFLFLVKKSEHKIKKRIATISWGVKECTNSKNMRTLSTWDCAIYKQDCISLATQANKKEL